VKFILHSLADLYTWSGPWFLI